MELCAWNAHRFSDLAGKIQPKSWRQINFHYNYANMGIDLISPLYT